MKRLLAAVVLVVALSGCYMPMYVANRESVPQMKSIWTS